MKTLVFLLLAFVVLRVYASDRPLFRPVHPGQVTSLACADRMVLPEVHDLAIHDKTSADLLLLMLQGNCSPSPATFPLVRIYTFYLPSGPQAGPHQIAEIEIPIDDIYSDKPSGKTKNVFMMAEDIEPVPSK